MNKLPKGVDQLPSGKYRVRKMINGRRQSLLFDAPPTQKDVLLATNELLNEVPGATLKGTFLDYAEKYIKAKENVLSASTIRGYRATLKGIPGHFTSLPLKDITQYTLTALVNDMVRSVSPKTVYNRHGLIVSVLHEFRPDFVIRTKLPRKAQKDIYTPGDEEVSILFAYLEDSPTLKKYWIPLYLASLGLRRSEIGALSIADLSEDDILTINKAKVLGSDNKWVIQNFTKTERSNRKIPLPKELADRIRQQGFIYQGDLNSIFCIMTAAQKKLGLPHFGVHRLRSYFASKAHALGLHDSIILKLGGWKSDHIMKGIYRKALQEDLHEESKTFLDHMTKQVVNKE
ncbi:site-specific integrase [Oribacterium sinus]